MTNGNNQRGINWGNVPQWVTIFVSIFGIGVSGGWILSDKQNQEEIQELTESVAPLEQQKQNLEQEKQNLEQEKQNLEQEKQNLEQEKQKLDLEIQDLKSEIAQANTEKEKLKDELEKAKQELAKPIDISNRQRSYEFILNECAAVPTLSVAGWGRIARRKWGSIPHFLQLSFRLVLRINILA